MKDKQKNREHRHLQKPEVKKRLNVQDLKEQLLLLVLAYLLSTSYRCNEKKRNGKFRC